jgi:hypothetical protein
LGTEWNNETATCEASCDSARDAKIAECGGEDYVNWINWSEETCSGATCCPSGSLTLTGVCIPLCPYIDKRVPGDLRNYGNGICVNPECSGNEIENENGECEHNCFGLAQIDVTTGECFVPVPVCGNCETLSEGDCIAPAMCPPSTYRNFETCECTDEAMPECEANHHWNGIACVPDEVKRCGVGYIKDADGNCIDDPTWCPTGKHYDVATKTCIDNSPLGPGEDPLDPAAPDTEKLTNIEKNTGKTTDNTRAIGESTERMEGSLTGISGGIDKIDQNTDGIEGLLEGIGDAIEGIGEFEGAEVTGDAVLPSVNSYDPALDELMDVTFFTKVSEYITSGMPVISYFNGTRVEISGSNPCLTTQMWGEQLELCVDPLEDIFDKAGLFLVGLASILGVYIIIRKG